MILADCYLINIINTLFDIQTIILILIVNKETMENGRNQSITNFIPLQKIGEGSFSSVYRVKRKADDKIYALKKIKIAALKEKQRQNALNQIRILASVFSPYIVQYREAFFDQNLNLLCVVMQLANEGDLQKKIEICRNRYSRFSEKQIWKMIYQTVKGLQALHSRFIMHRDIKSANIFISEGVYKLGDLNVSKIFNPSDIMARTQTGTPYYASPEVWRDEPYDTKSDIWSLGCVIYEMCALKPPFKGKDLQDLYQKVQKGKFQNIPTIYSKQLSQLIKLCLKKNSYDRPNCQQLLQNIIIDKCIEYKIEMIQEDIDNDLLKTIKLPSNLKQLHGNLPKSAYDTTNQLTKTQNFKIKVQNNVRDLEKQTVNKLKKQSDTKPRKYKNKPIKSEHQQHIDCQNQAKGSNPESISQRNSSKFFVQKSQQYYPLQLSMNKNISDPNEYSNRQKIAKRSNRSNRNYISQDKIKNLKKIQEQVQCEQNRQHLVQNKKQYKQCYIRQQQGAKSKIKKPTYLRKLSQQQKNYSSQKRKKNILGEINLLRKLSQNNAIKSLRKQKSQRYLCIDNSLQKLLKKVGSTERMYQKQRKSQDSARQRQPSNKKCISKRQNYYKQYEQISQLMKNGGNINPNKDIKKISSKCRLKNKNMHNIDKNKNYSYHERSSILHKNVKASAQQISLILQGHKKYSIQKPNRYDSHTSIHKQQSKLLKSPREQSHKLLQHRKINKISSTPYLASMINNNGIEEPKIKRKNKNQQYHRKDSKINYKLHLY